jgi:predicted Rossmann fold flavoprotein
MKTEHSPTLRPNRAIELAIIGGGAAGLFAAVTAASRGIPCLVVERKARFGAKLLMTANGRCNFTRDLTAEEFLGDLEPAAAAFAGPAIRAMPPRRIVAAFESIGLRVRRMRDGRIFPASGQAADVVHALGDALRDTEVPELFNAPVSGIRPLPSGGFSIALPAFDLQARRILVATGGLSFPKTGSVGDGHAWARDLGLNVTPLCAGLAGLEAPPALLASAGVEPGQRFEDAQVSVLDASGQEQFRTRGELEITPWGLAGAAIYNAQRLLVRAELPSTALRIAFAGRSLALRSIRPRPLKEAIVTLGGIDLSEIDPHTMSSRRYPGLSFAGEILDLDGPTGGYNLTLAFATAHLAVSQIEAR